MFSRPRDSVTGLIDEENIKAEDSNIPGTYIPLESQGQDNSKYSKRHNENMPFSTPHLHPLSVRRFTRRVCRVDLRSGQHLLSQPSTIIPGRKILKFSPTFFFVSLLYLQQNCKHNNMEINEFNSIVYYHPQPCPSHTPQLWASGRYWCILLNRIKVILGCTHNKVFLLELNHMP